MSNETASRTHWYDGVSRYSWLVLAIASAGWVFDTFEGQIFNISRNQLLQEILRVGPGDASIKLFGDFFLAVFLVGGTVGGLLFGSLADRFGRRPTMIATILMYSIFSGLTYFAHSLWAIGLLRFLVAMGVGGEWAVAASLVAEVFPKNARAHASGIFHATSVVGTWLATLAGLAVGAHWRLGFVVGVVPALLVLWVRSSVRESDRWQSKAEEKKDSELGSFRALLRHPQWGRRAWLGMLLAAVGLASFWGVTVAGQNLAEEMLRSSAPATVVAQKSKFAYGIIETAGGGLGLLAFGPISVRLGRKKTFVLMQLAALAIVPVTCYAPQNYGQLLLLLPIFGFFTLSIHAGFAIYFPELFPTHLRATGTGFCFNGGRILAAPMLWFSGWLKSVIELRLAITLLGLLFVLGLLVVKFLPETKDQPLPE